MEFIDDPSSDVMAYVTPSFSSTDASKADKLTLTVNMTWFENLSATDVNGTGERDSFYLDRVIAHELTHAIMAAKIDNAQELPSFILEGMAELTHGADDIRIADIENLVIDPSPLEMIFSGVKTNLDYAAGYIFFRYLAKQVSEGNYTIPADKNANQFIENTLDGAIIQTHGGKDTITNYGNNVSVNAGNGNNVIDNLGPSTIEYHADGSLTVSYGDLNHNVTIITGKSNDVISNFYGKDTKIDSGAGNDTVYNGDYGESAKIDTGNGNDYVFNGYYSSNSKISLGAGNDTLVNKNSERITVNGGKGNDLIDIDANSGNILIEYAVGDGNDTVCGYNLTDTVRLTGGAITDTSVTNDNLILKTDSGSITFIDALTVNVNGKLYGNSATLGTNSNDNLVNIDSDITLNGYGGNDTIDNYGGNVLINAGKGKNLIRNYAPSTVITGNGDNTIYNANYVPSKIICGTGNDSIYNDWASSIIEAGAGNDTIINRFASLLKGGDGDDVIIDEGHHYSTVNGGKGNDTIYNHTRWTGEQTIEYRTGDGNDVVYGYNSNDTILIVGKYTTSTVDNDVIIKVGDGSILLKDAVDKMINIANTESLLISGTAVDDSIENALSSATINALGGNDYIWNRICNVSISGGAGNDTIENSSLNYSIVDEITINGGEGNDKIHNSGDKSDIDGGAGNDTVDNLGSDCLISGGIGNDNISNYGSNDTINGGDGNDSIFNWSNYSRGDNISISGGAGNDYIQNEGNNVTVSGGEGNDYVRDSGMGTAYVYSAGNDTLSNFNILDTIVLGSVKVNSSVRSGDDVILKLSNNNTLTLANYKSSKVNIVKSISDVEKTNVIHNDDDSIIITGAKQANFIKNFGDNVTIDCGEGNDKIENCFTYNGRGNNVLIQCGAGYDSVKNYGKNVTIEGGAGNDYVYNYTYDYAGSGTAYVYSAGNDTLDSFNDLNTIVLDSVKINSSVRSDDTVTLNLDNNNTLTLTNYRASKINIAKSISDVKRINIIKNNTDYKIIKGTKQSDYIDNNGDNVTMNGGKGNDFIYNRGASSSINAGAGNDSIKSWWDNVTINGGTGNDSIYSGGSKVLFEYNVGDGSDFIEGFNDSSTLQIGDGKVTYSTKTGDEDVIVTVGKGKITLAGAASLKKLNIYGTSTELKLTNKTTSPVTVEAHIKTVDASARTKSAQITGNDTLVGNSGNDVFVYKSGKDVITDYATGDKISLGAAISKSTVKGSDVVFTVGKGSLIVKKAKGKTLSLIDSKGREYSTVLGGTTLTLTNDKESVVSVDAAVKVIDASQRKTAVKITGNAKANTIIGSKGNDTLTGGNGNDVFVYGAGNDVITDYATGDKISLGAAISKSTVKGSDVVFTVGKGSLIVKKAKGKTLSLIDSKGREYSTVLGGTTLTLTNDKESVVSVGSSVKVIDASQHKTAVKIIGNTKDNTIIGGSKNNSLYGAAGNDSLVGNTGNDKLFGGKGKDTLVGGRGNDSLWGNAGADTFIYESGDGKDVIFGFENKDTLTFDNIEFTTSYSKKNSAVSFKVAGGSVTLKDFTASTFHINNDIYKINGAKFVKQK